MNDAALFMAGMAVFLLVLCALGVVADSWERRDVRRRNRR